MRRKIIALMLAATTALCLSAPQIALAKNGQNAAAIIGAAAGFAIGAAAMSAASSDYRYQDQYVPPPPPPPPPPRYRAPFSPAGGVVCYPQQRACYNDAGNYLPSWSSRVF
jgi:hypothetical protein